MFQHDPYRDDNLAGASAGEQQPAADEDDADETDEEDFHYEMEDELVYDSFPLFVIVKMSQCKIVLNLLVCSSQLLFISFCS